MLKNDGNPYAPMDTTVVVEDVVEEIEVESVLPEDVNTVKQIIEWVGSNEDRAILVLAEEEERDNPRKTLITALEEVING